MDHTLEITEEENERRYKAIMEHIHNRPVPPFMEWWEVENTGWSGGISWFSTGDRANPYRAKSVAEAIEYIGKARWDDAQVLWRYVHVTLERVGNRSVETREWTLVD